MARKTASGTAGEDIAVEYLEKEGFRILQRNYRFQHGEIDIVADNAGTLVFVEVKARRSKQYGEPEDAVTQRKRALIRRTAEGYLFEHGIDDRQCRFDVVAIDFCERTPAIRHIEDAF